MYDSITGPQKWAQRVKAIFCQQDPATVNMKRYLAELDYDWSEFTLTSFINWLTNSLGQPIILVPCCLPPNICGAYVISPSGHNLILFDKNLPPLLRLHTILHEIAHLLCGHQTARLDHRQMQILASINSQSDLVLSESVINRNPSCKTDRQEQEAEALALLIQSQVQLAKNQDEIITPVVYTELVSFW